MTVYLIEIVTPNGDWLERFIGLREGSFSSIPYEDMGFPPEWEEFAMWQRHLQ